MPVLPLALPWHQSDGNISPVTPKFSEMTKVLVRYDSGPQEGYVVGIREMEGNQIYNIAHWDQDVPDPSWDNWVPEEWLEAVK